MQAVQNINFIFAAAVVMVNAVILYNQINKPCRTHINKFVLVKMRFNVIFQSIFQIHHIGPVFGVCIICRQRNIYAAEINFALQRCF